jgi:Family of unknown function (DUF6088)
MIGFLYIPCMRSGTTSKSIARMIERGGVDRLWTYKDFRPFSESTVSAALSRLRKKGYLVRVRKGVYYRPRGSRFGASTPEPTRVAEAVLKGRGISAVSSGLPAYNALGLTTQVSQVPTFAVEGSVGSLRTGRASKIRLRPVSSVRGLKPEERVVLDSLRDLRLIPDTTPEEVLRKIANLFRDGRVSYERVARAARTEPPRVRALVGLLGSMIRAERKIINRLLASLNKTTKFKYGLMSAFPEARQWGIV